MYARPAMREKLIERHLVAEVTRLGGFAPKWVSPGHTGVPDRLCFLPGGYLIAVECKAPGKKPTLLQAKVLRQLEGLGFRVAVVDSHTDVDALMMEYELWKRGQP